MTRRRIFYGWWIVGLVFLGGAFGGVAIWWGFTAFFDPLVKEFGWSYAAISFAVSLRGVELGIMDVAAGFLIDRLGGRRIILGGAAILALGCLWLARMSSLGEFYIAFLIVFLGGTAFSNVIFYSLISRWFRRRLGLALGISGIGFAAGGLGVPLVVYLLDLAGLRLTFVVIGAMGILVGGLLAYFIRNEPKDMGLVADGVVRRAEQNGAGKGVSYAAGSNNLGMDDSLKGAVRSAPLWILTLVSAVSIFCVSMVTTHVMPYLEHVGYARHTAALVAMLIPVTGSVGILGAGWISDLTGRKAVLLIALLSQLVAIILFLYVQHTLVIIPFLLLFGFGWGGMSPLRPVMLREYYGTTNIGSLIGLCLGLSQFGGVVGPPLAGWIFDMTGGYGLAFLVAAALLLVPVPLVLLLKPAHRSSL